MTNQTCKFLIVLVFLAAPALLRGQATESSINSELKSLGVASGPPGPGGPMPGGPPASPVPDAQRPAAILQAAKDISSLPAGPAKVKFADSLVHASVQGAVGLEALQASGDTLAKALTETPQQPGKNGLPPQPYMDLAKLVRYAGITTSLSDPQLAKAVEILTANEADVAKIDFTLKDLNGKKVTLSALKGKIVLVNFWSGACIVCRKEMVDLDLIYTHFQSQGLVILSILSPTPENPIEVNHYLERQNYHPPVLFDDDAKVAKQFHIDGEPRSFVFDRDGKLVAQSIDMCTQRQFFSMLAKGGLHP